MLKNTIKVNKLLFALVLVLAFFGAYYLVTASMASSTSGVLRGSSWYGTLN